MFSVRVYTVVFVYVDSAFTWFICCWCGGRMESIIIRKTHGLFEKKFNCCTQTRFFGGVMVVVVLGDGRGWGVLDNCWKYQVLYNMTNVSYKSSLGVRICSMARRSFRSGFHTSSHYHRCGPNCHIETNPICLCLETVLCLRVSL